MKLKQLLTISLLTLFTSTAFSANERPNSTPAAQGYDVVSYQNAKRPQRGNGNFVIEHNDIVYLFSNKENQQTFKRNPEKYIPAYGGYCAYGVSVGKKFIGDPEVWRIVDGKLYLNLDNSIQIEWQKDLQQNIKTADVKWKKIKHIPRAAL